MKDFEVYIENYIETREELLCARTNEGVAEAMLLHAMRAASVKTIEHNGYEIGRRTIPVVTCRCGAPLAPPEGLDPNHKPERLTIKRKTTDPQHTP